VVDRAGGNGKDFAARAPVLLIEVLSPEDVEIDLGDKVAEYLQIPSPLGYVVLSQNEPKAWCGVACQHPCSSPPDLE
jgi:Uma2 family endonuclease